MNAHHHIAGVILAGGGGTRMFPGSQHGGDKALVPLAGRPIIAHVADILRPQTGHLLINANGDPRRFAGLCDTVVADARPDEGPLAGLLAAMDWVASYAGDVEALVSVSTDTPFIPPNLVESLMAGATGGPAVAMSDQRLHPVIGLWPLTLRDSLAETLSQGRRSVEKFARHHAAIAVPFSLRTIGAGTVDPFFNINTPQDLAHAESLLGEKLGRPGHG